MQRRKFIAAVGSLTAAGAAGVGTGAFNFANVERSANMQVVGDKNAFLALKDTSGYARSGNNGTLQLAFDENSDAMGSGINQESDYSFTGVFCIKNQGDQPVGVWIDDSRQNDSGNGDAVNWYGTDADDKSDFSTSIEGPGNAYQLDVGEQVFVNVTILTRGIHANWKNLPDTVNIKADASQG
jgi:hypothetical protein